MLPKKNGKISLKGKLGRELNQQEGYEAARLCIINGLAAVKAELGNLERIRRILKIVGYVASEEGFFCQPQVINGASDLLVDIFGDNGKHARVAVGVAELPENVPVEIELVLEIKNTEEINELDQDRISDHLLNRIEQKKKTKNRNRGPYRKAAVA
jgi:enamine deaminase RidA (YjgF/YER057c/UK114 family)